jgi:hypothetical protein
VDSILLLFSLLPFLFSLRLRISAGYPFPLRGPPLEYLGGNKKERKKGENMEHLVKALLEAVEGTVTLAVKATVYGIELVAGLFGDSAPAPAPSRKIIHGKDVVIIVKNQNRKRRR